MAKGIAKSAEAEAARRRKISESRKRKMAEQGFLNSPETRQKIGIAGIGRPCSQKTREIMSNVKKGKLPKNFFDMQAKGHATPKPRGEYHHSWKGDRVGYIGLHIWVVKALGRPTTCEHCGSTTRKLEWANKDHKYRRNINDWIRLCRFCHRRYDKIIRET